MLPLPRTSSRASCGAKSCTRAPFVAGAVPMATSTPLPRAVTPISVPGGAYRACGGPSNGVARPADASSVWPPARSSHEPPRTTTQASRSACFHERDAPGASRAASKPTYRQLARCGVTEMSVPSRAGAPPRISRSIPRRLRLLSKMAALALLARRPLLPRGAHARLLGDLGRHDLPPRFVARDGGRGIGLDHDDRRLGRGLRVVERGAQLRDRAHADGARAEARGIRHEVDRQRRRGPEPLAPERSRKRADRRETVAGDEHGDELGPLAHGGAVVPPAPVGRTRAHPRQDPADRA